MNMVRALAAGTLMVAPPLQAQAPEDHKERILVVIAHPDDETPIAPALAAKARDGARVTILFVTPGDQGPGVSGMKPGSELAQTRREEGKCSAAALGATAQFVDGIGDGTLSQRPRDPDSAAKRALPILSAAIRDSGADTVMTWGPDGGYGHGDHRMLNALVTQILQAQDAQNRPQLLYFSMIHTPLPPVLEEQGWTTTAPDLAPIRVAYTPADLAAADTATQCHKTQFDEATRAMITPGFHAAVWKGEVAFRPAF